jgi:hypothetical protein
MYMDHYTMFAPNDESSARRICYFGGRKSAKEIRDATMLNQE